MAIEASMAAAGQQIPGTVAQLVALNGAAPTPVMHAVLRSTRRPDNEPIETFEIAGEAPSRHAAGLDGWLACNHPAVDRLAVAVLVIRETLDDRGMIVRCTLERRRGAADGPLYGEPARVDFSGPARAVRLYRAHLDGRLAEMAPVSNSTPVCVRPREQFAGELGALDRRFGAGIHVLDSREPTASEDMAGLSTVFHLRSADGREVACGLGWHGNLPFVLEADFPRFAATLELTAEQEAAVQAALLDEDLVRGETRLDESGIAIIGRRRGGDSLFLLRPAPGAVRIEPYMPRRSPAAPDQQKWMKYAESYESLTVLDGWRDGTTDDVMVLTCDLSGQVWRHHIDIDGVETWRKTDNEAAIGVVHREHRFARSRTGTLTAIVKTTSLPAGR